MNNNFDLSKELLDKNGEIIGTAKGNSMFPLFRSGKDRAVVVPLTKKLCVNNVILYRKNNTNDIVLHRVVKIIDGKPILRGDNLFYKEDNVTYDNILGVLKGFYRNKKYYECDKSLLYKFYVIYIRLSYPLRFFSKKAFSVLQRKKGLFH